MSADETSLPEQANHGHRVFGEPSYAPEPGTVPLPGETLLEWLEENGHTQVWLANALGVSPKHLNRIIRGHSAYSADFALRLADVTGVSARFWMSLQADYQINHARTRPSVNRPPATPRKRKSKE